DAHPPRADDRARHDHRHDPDGARPRRRRRAERAARPRRDRRPRLRHRLHPALRAGGLRRRPSVARQTEIEMADNARTLRRAKILTLAVVAALVLLGGRTVFSRISNARSLEASAQERNKIYVRVATPNTDGAGLNLALPGTLQGFVQAPIAARASGYLKKWHKDIGSRVEQGELLAEIETPEIDQQLSPAVA